MSKLFLDILNLSIAASWLIAAVIAVRFLFRQRAPKWVNCLMWGIVGLRLLIPFTLESDLSLVPSRETVNTDAFYSAAVPEAVPPAVDTEADVQTPPVDTGNTDAALPEPTPDFENAKPQDQEYIQSGIDALDDRLNPVINGTLSSVIPSEETPLHKAVNTASYIWLAGAVLMLVYAVINYLFLKKRVSAAIPFGNAVRKSERVDTPFILGIFRPRIYLPFGLSPETEECVIAHEKAHIKRRDHLIKPIGYAVLSVYWFNPLVWLAYILLCRDIECACDEKVIRNMSAEARKSYATALLECSMRKNYIAACPLAFGEIGVKDRVKNTMSYKKPTFWVILSAVLVCITVSVFFLTSPGKAEKGDTSETVSNDLSQTESSFSENADIEQSQNPEENKQPDESKLPEESIIPEESKLPDESEIPEESKLPEESTQPEVSTQPEESVPPVEVHSHSYTSNVVAATCNAQGYTEHICSCGESYKDSYTAKEIYHNFKKTRITEGTLSYEAYSCEGCALVVCAHGNVNGNINPQPVRYYITRDYYEGPSTLVIYGVGDMPDNCSNWMWQTGYYEIENIIISEGITSVGAYAFNDTYDRVKNITIADSVTKIGYYAMYSMSYKGIVKLGEGVTSLASFSLPKKCSGVYLPKSLTYTEVLLGGYDKWIYYQGTEEEFKQIRYYSAPTGNVTLSDQVNKIGNCVNFNSWY